ncbi:hypothetical protein HF650_24335 (plasmid) [Kosakonia sp. SMBL-WEM22]|uniref:hypothetical protein n=1 Tax=Kosakonia sp. SMBL-WEM22 TaxID=2725560 RepID=UPI00165969E4|nr:hypothetical protein [Kosakonia sp. SMBL-WEM22]QNQ22901.1 hypothetical protein HF650_24335 [Kosakonia sp. SMBL-WEM22]
MCVFCKADRNYFHTAECVYDQLVQEYPVMCLRNLTRTGTCYILRELLSPEGRVLAIQNAPPETGWRLHMRDNETVDEELDLRQGDMIELPSQEKARQVFMTLWEWAAIS